MNVRTILAAGIAAASITGLAACGTASYPATITQSQVSAAAKAAASRQAAADQASASASASAAAAKAATHKAAVARRAAAVASAAPTPAASLPLLIVNSYGSNYAGIEPAWIGFSGDGGNVVTNIVWSSWTASSAVGAGTSDIQGCVPDCATGTETPVPATITLSDPVNGKFTAITEVRSDGTWTQWPQSASQTDISASVTAPSAANAA